MPSVFTLYHAVMVELAYTPDLRSGARRHVGSTPTGSIFGDLAERIIATVLKIVGRKAPGFESLSLRFMITSKKADKSLLFVF